MVTKKSVSNSGNKNWVRNIITLLAGAVIGFLVYIIITRSSNGKSGFEDLSGTTYTLNQLDWKVPCNEPHSGTTTINGIARCSNYKSLDSGYTLTITEDKMIIRQEDVIQATIDIMGRKDVRGMWGMPAVKYTIGPVKFVTANPDLQELHKLKATELYMTSNDFAHMLADVNTGFTLSFQD